MRRLKKYISAILFIIYCTIFTISSFQYNSLAFDDSSYIWSGTRTDDAESSLVSTEIGNTVPNNEASNNTASNNNETNNTVSENTIQTISTEDNSLSLECESAILIEQTTGQILYSHNSHEQLHPASVTKVMSILLIMEALSNQKIALTDKIPCSENAASMGGSQIWLDPRETLTVDEMLKAICVNSAND